MSEASPITNGQVLDALKSLRQRLGYNPSAADIDDSRSMPLGASAIIGRFGSLHRAILEAQWFRQPAGPDHEPIDMRTLSLSVRVGELLNPGRSQVLELAGLATIEELLRAHAILGHPVGGLFAPDSRAQKYGLFMQTSKVTLLDVTASARAYEAIGTMVLQRGEPYPDEVPAAMVVVYDLTPYGWVHEGRFGIPRSFNLDDYVRATYAPATPS